MPKAGKTVDSRARLFRRGAVDGFGVVNPSFNSPGIDFLAQSKGPLVAHGRDRPKPHYPLVDLGNRRVGDIVASKLVALGHRNIATAKKHRGASPSTHSP